MGEEYDMVLSRVAICAALLTGLLIVIHPESAVRAAEPGFTVDSYIPEYFRDFEWRVEGGMQLAGPGDQRVRILTLPREGDTRSTYSNDRQMLDVNSYFKYRYRTIPRFLTVALGVGAQYDHFNNFGSSLTTVPGDFSDYDITHQNNHTYEFRLYPSIDAGAYVYEDFFVSAVSSIQYGTEGVFDGKESNHTEHFDVVSIDTTYVYIADESSNRPNDRKRYSVDAALLPGWGRLYEGYFAATALYMVDELRREGLLEREPTADEMRQLCEQIYYYKLKHPVDTRLLKIDALRHIMDLFIDNNLISDPGPYGYLLIQDVWDYFPRQERLFGFRFRFGPGIEYASDRMSSSADREDYTQTYLHTPTGDVALYDNDLHEVYSSTRKNEFRRTYVEAIAEYHKPLDIRWQFDGVVSAAYYPYAHEFTNNVNRRYRETVSPYEYMQDTYIVYNAMYDIAASGGVEYILSSRTSSRLTAGYVRSHYNSAIQYSHSYSGETAVIDPIGREDRETDEVIFQGTLTYRLSIPTTLGISASYRIVDQTIYRDITDDRDWDEYRLSVALSHYLY